MRGDRFGNAATLMRLLACLPHGVFAPYTGIPTNLVFFEACALESEETYTKEVWYYELPLPEGRNSYSKTKPLQYEEFADCIKWWYKREENERAWRVPVEQILAKDCNLDIKNPNAKEDYEHLPPEQLVEDILKKEQRIAEIIVEIKQALGENKQ